MGERIDVLDDKPFLDGPTETLVKSVISEIGKVEQFKRLFGDFVDPYMRTDYPVRALPVLRIYNRNFMKESESWWIVGDLTADAIFPPSIRRTEFQNVQDVVTSALLQQFRRTPFFTTLEGLVPGLNELGKRFSVEKDLSFQSADGLAPTSRIEINFRIDIEKWDLYLQSQCRTVDDPFRRTLEDMESIVAAIEGLRDDDTVSVELEQEISTKLVE